MSERRDPSDAAGCFDMETLVIVGISPSRHDADITSCRPPLPPALWGLSGLEGKITISLALP